MSPRIRISDELKEKLDQITGKNYTERINRYANKLTNEKASEILTERDVVQLIEKYVDNRALK